MIRRDKKCITDFNPRSPRGERRCCNIPQGGCPGRFQSTLPSRGATQQIGQLKRRMEISIHAPLAGSDDHAGQGVQVALRFQSTLPSRGATNVVDQPAHALGDFNPRSPRGERRPPWVLLLPPPGISIHAPLAGSDGPPSIPWPRRSPHFNPRSPRGERPNRSRHFFLHIQEFQSTLPSRGATMTSFACNPIDVFQSTLPSRGATTERR